MAAFERDKILDAAQKLVEKKRFDKAILEYQKVLQHDPKDVRTLLKVGDLHLKQGEFVEAVETYERVGEHYASQGFALKAIAVFKQIREIISKQIPQQEDRYAHIVPRLAELYTQLGLTSDALATYDDYATRLLRGGRDRDAIDVFKKVVALEPSNPLPHLRLGEAYIRVKEVDAAMERFGTAAEILLKLGRKDDALRVVERVLQYRQEGRFARLAAEVLLDRGGPSDAMAALQKLQIAFKENRKDLETLALLARAFDQAGHASNAIEVLKESAAIAKESNNLGVLSGIVDQLLQRAPDDELVKSLAAGLKPKPTTPKPEAIPESAIPLSAIPVSAAPDSRGPAISMSEIDVQVDDEAELLEDEEPSEEAPFELRPNQPSQAALEVAARVSRWINHAEQHRRRDIGRAVNTLKSGIAELPDARELRQRLFDVLLEGGDQDLAMEEMIGWARHLVSRSRAEEAAQQLDEVLLLEPNHAEARQILAHLGYAVPVADPTTGSGGSGREVYTPDAPLPSYDLEGVGARNVLPPVPGSLDEPFASRQELPSFAMEDEATTYLPQQAQPPPLPQPAARAPRHSPAPTSVGHRPAAPALLGPAAVTPVRKQPPTHPILPAVPSQPPVAAKSVQQRPLTPVPTSVSAPPPSLPVPPPPESRQAQLDEDALEEVEFFATHGMFDEARALLDSELQRLPNHPLLLERLREVEALAQTASHSGTRVVPRTMDEQPAHAQPHAAAPSYEDDRAFDIAASLDALDALESPEAEGPVDAATQQVSVETVFEAFKAGVAKTISESDASTHYDLGMAYRDMGLYMDAINEFSVASRDPARECVCLSMIGMIHMQLGNVDAAIDAWLRGLHASVKSRDQELALMYEVADAYEARGVPDQALYYFERVGQIDANHKDPRGPVQERIKKLRPKPANAPKAGQKAVGSELDEFDQAFDDLFGAGNKLP